jgi:hypothetical protein
MRNHNCVVSGSSVLWLIEGFSTHWHPHDLDVYVPEGKVDTVVQYFLQMGYIVDACHTGLHKYFLDGYLSSVTKLKNTSMDVAVDILESASDQAVMPVLYFHSTIVMNWMDADHLALLYPATTLAKVGVVQDDVDSYDDGWIAKYQDRGYRLCHETTVVPRFVINSIHTLHQYLGHRRCLVVGITGQSDRCAAMNSFIGLEDLYHLQNRFLIDPSYHRYCGSDTCELTEAEKHVLCMLHAI